MVECAETSSPSKNINSLVSSNFLLGCNWREKCYSIFTQNSNYNYFVYTDMVNDNGILYFKNA